MLLKCISTVSPPGLSPIMTRLISNFAKVIKLRVTIYSPDQFGLNHVSGDGSRWWRNTKVRVSSKKKYLASSEPILAFGSLKDAVWCREVPFNYVSISIITFNVILTFCHNTQKLYPQNRQSHPNTKLNTTHKPLAQYLRVTS
jgi:hypothetical protein